MHFKKVMHLHQAKEAARISGRTVFNQRNDARFGLLAEHERHGGKNHYDLYGIAEMLVIQLLANRGIGPSTGQKFAQAVRTQIGFWALMQPGAIKDQTGEFFEFYESKGWDVASAFIYGSEGFEYFKYLIIWPNDTWDLADSLDQSIDPKDDEFALHGAVTILDLEYCGKHIAKTSNHQLATIIKPMTNEEFDQLSKLIDEPPVSGKTDSTAN